MVQGDAQTGVSTVTPTLTNLPNSNKNSNPTRLFDENGLMDSSGEKKKKVGNYIISKTIGEGSFAKVRLGFHLITQQKVRFFCGSFYSFIFYLECLFYLFFQSKQISNIVYLLIIK